MIGNITINNAAIDMVTNTISGTADLQIPSLVQITDADMCINRISDPEKFALNLLEYATVRVNTSPGKYVDNRNLPNNGYSYVSNFPGLQSWANNIIVQTYPEYYPMIDSISLYARGGFSIMCRIYLN